MTLSKEALDAAAHEVFVQCGLTEQTSRDVAAVATRAAEPHFRRDEIMYVAEKLRQDEERFMARQPQVAEGLRFVLDCLLEDMERRLG